MFVGIWKETASGGKDSRHDRKQVMALAQARQIDLILAPLTGELAGQPLSRKNFKLVQGADAGGKKRVG